MSTTQYLNVSQSLQNLKDETRQKNFEAIQKLIDHCAAEGIGESQQTRIIYAWKTLLTKFASDDFQVQGASEDELKSLVAKVNRSDYAEPTKHKFRSSIKKFYKVENGGEHPEKVKFFSVHKSSKPSTVTREDLFKKEELKRLLGSFNNIRDRALVYVLYESAARPGELLSRNIGDFTSNTKGDFIFLEGAKETPDRTNQLVRAGRSVREWISQHPFGGELGDIENPNAPLWVKNQQHACLKCGDTPQRHSDQCEYDPDRMDPVKYDAFLRRFKNACEEADIPENKRRPYNLRHTRLTEVATFMGYEQLNKFAGWTPGSDRAKVYVHLNNDDVNQAIRDQYGLETEEDEEQTRNCPFCGTKNESVHSDCRNCGRAMSLEEKTQQEEKQDILERLAELEEQGVIDKLEQFQQIQ